jgi:hypothetical protein
MFALLPLLACTATIRVSSDIDGADIYLTRNTPPSTKEAPSVYLAHDEGELTQSVSYWSWDTYWAWVGAPGYAAEVVEIPNEVKVGPVIAAVLCGLWPAIWAYGPDESSVVRVSLDKKKD